MTLGTDGRWHGWQYLRRSRVNVVVPGSSANLRRVARAVKVTLRGVEDRRVTRHGIIAETLVAVHHTGDGVAICGASIDTILDSDGGKRRGDVVVQGHETT
jgi:hypothetical protein